MEVFRDINSLIRRAFVVVKYNMVLTLPFLLFWLVLGFVMLPISQGGGAVFYTFALVAALISAFLSGWFNMFKKAVETAVDQNEPDEKHVYDSFSLYKEFFPGVGKYFTKIILGIIMVFLLFNIFMFIVEAVLMPLMANFESLNRQDLAESLKNAGTASEFWQGVSDADKAKLLQIAGLEAVFALLFTYLTMFWVQLVVLEDKFPIKALEKSFKTIIKDPARTSTVFFGNVIFLSVITLLGAVLALNPLVKLVFILLFVYALIFYVMMTFVYLERYGEIDSIRLETHQ